MIEAYFHTMLLLQQALREDADDTGVVFVASRQTRMGNQWHLSPGPADLGEGTALVLPQGLGARSIGIGVVDADETQRDVYGTDVVQVTVTAVVGAESDASWFEGKAASARIGTIDSGAYPTGVPGDVFVTPNDLNLHCDIQPLRDYGVPDTALANLELRAIRALRGESFIAQPEDDVQVFWRSFVAEFA